MVYLSKEPKVSIITVDYNSANVTADLFRSLAKITYPNFEVVLVNNGSPGSLSHLLEEFPWVQMIEAGANLGFAGGNNKGIKVASGDYILLLNNDTEVEPGFLEPLVARLANNKNIGVVSPKILFFTDPSIIQFAGFSPIHPISGRGFSIGTMEKDLGQYNKAQPTSRAHGAAMMFSREALEKVGLMPEVFFLYYEEMDYCEKFKRAGYEIWYEPACRVWHKESMSTGKNSPLKTYYYSRNRLLYLRRNTPRRWKFLMYVYYIIVATPKNLIQHSLHGEWAHFKSFWRGLIWNMVNGTKDIYDYHQKTNQIAGRH